jgi:hypothetical protein
LFVLAPAAARAEDPPPDPLIAKVVALETQVAQHVAQKAAGALLLDAGEAATLHKEVTARPELTKRVIAVFQTLVRSVKEPKEKQHVLEALAETGDPEGASVVKPFLRQPNVKTADELLLACIAVAGRVPGKETVEPLLKIVEDSKHMGAASAATKALACFRNVKSKRVKILTTLVDVVQPLQPGGRPGPRGGGGIGDSDSGPAPYPNSEGSPAERWAALSAILPDALNALTGQTCGSVTQWFQMVKEAKPNYERLFTDA